MTTPQTTETADIPSLFATDFSELLNHGELQGIAKVDPQSSARNVVFAQVKFRVGTHQSFIEANDTGTLILAAQADGDLTARFDGTAFDHHTRSGFMVWSPPGIT